MTALDDAGLLNEDGSFITASHTHALDVIGVISRGGEYDPETGNVITPPDRARRLARQLRRQLARWVGGVCGIPGATGEGVGVSPVVAVARRPLFKDEPLPFNKPVTC
jgi:hypothetical protein